MTVEHWDEWADAEDHVHRTHEWRSRRHAVWHGLLAGWPHVTADRRWRITRNQIDGKDPVWTVLGPDRAWAVGTVARVESLLWEIGAGQLSDFTRDEP